MRGAGGGRVSIAGVACYRPGDRPHLFYQLRVYRRRKGEPKGFTWADYRDLIISAHHRLSAPLVWVWDNLNIHLASELAEFAAANKAWLRVYRLLSLPARLIRHARHRVLKISRTWPWKEAFLACWQRLCTLPAPA